MKIYHYTSLSDWEEIKQGSYVSNHKPGLGANRRVGRVNNEAWNTTAVFALLEAIPKNWTHNKEFPDIWARLKRDIGKVLLEINIDEKDQSVFVIDRSELQKYLDIDNTNQSEEEKKMNRDTAEGKYIGSRISLFDYLKKENNHSYTLPEVIITEDIPIEKVSISKEQPLLEELLSEIKGEYRNRIVKQIKDIPELKDWYEKKYITENKEQISEIRNKLR